MNLADWLQRLRARGIRVANHGDKLRIQAPPGTLTDEIKGELAARKDDLLDYLKAQDHAVRAPGPQRAVSRAAERPLSSAQKRMWLLHRLAPESPLYNNFFGLRTTFRFDSRLLDRSIEHVVERHEILRTVYRLGPEGPLQRVLPASGIEVKEHDLSDLPEDSRRERLHLLERECAESPFDLATGPLLRLALVSVGPNDHRLLVTQHHIITDGRSTMALLDELFAEYRALSTGQRLERPPLPLQYADYAEWEQERLSSDALSYQRRYWQEKLAGLPDLDLPVDRATGPSSSVEGAIVAHTIPEELTEGARSLAQSEGTTLFAVLATTLSCLLHRYSGQRDFGFGIVTDGRVRDELSDLLGVFINTLVLRTAWNDDPTFREHLRLVRDDVLGALDHQEIPFEEVNRLVAPTREGRNLPLARVCFVMESRRSSHPGATAYSDCVDSSVDGTAKFDLYVAMVETERGIECSFQYRTELFERTTVETLARHFETVLREAIDDPEQRLSLLPLLSASETAALVVGDDDAVSLPSPAAIHRAIEHQVKQAPDAVALEGNERLTYGELNERANRLARVLKERGIGANDLVGILLPRRVELVVAVLAVLKSGGAYVPLDPAYPRDRVRFMIEDSGARVIVTDSSMRSFVEDVAADPIYLDDHAPLVQAQPATNLELSERDDQLAYVIYTSGSTGTPKGVMLEHAQVSNFFVGMDRVVPHDPPGTWLAVTSLSFDISVLELLWTLARGFQVVLDPGGGSGGFKTAELIERHRVTHLQGTPSLLQMLLADAVGQNALASLRHVFVGGEALPSHLAQELDRVLHGSLTNMYGPTETTVWSTTYEVDEVAAPIPIGRPIANTRCYVLDGQLRPVPRGARGELYIGGLGVARGYLNRADLTAERFLPDPFAPAAGARMYRTGDVARHRTDGLLEYLGRVDDQVKLRGHRIELGEIETAIDQHDAVGRSAVVVVNAGGADRLLGFWVAAPGRTPLAADDVERELRKSLGDRLPSYMVPASFKRLEAFPLTPNGKIDRRALRNQPSPAAPLEEANVPEASPTRAMLRSIWSQVLGSTTFGLDTPFFEAGGDSMLLVHVHDQITKALQRAVPLTKLFEFPTIRSLADYLDGHSSPLIATPGVEVSPSAEVPDIAVIGMSGRFPGAANLTEFWTNLSEGIESISRFTEAELVASGVPRKVARAEGYVPAKGYLEGSDLFDAEFFDFSPRDAVVTDPQQRVFLECSHSALEDAGYVPERFPGAIGVFGGSGANTYVSSVLSDSDIYRVFIHNDKDFLATRVAYKLNLNGPAVAVQTACSTSLVAVIMACQSLWRGECDMALAGGVSISTPLKAGYVYREGMIFSPDGHCRPFDADGSGTLSGNGVGVVVLRRLEDALRAGDRIDAVVKGGAINNDGAQKVHFTAPSVQGQARVIERAHAIARVPADTISYVEAHGTATHLGDPIEVAALRHVFQASGAERAGCAIGSVKSNIGHLDTAAGIAGFIKATLAVKQAAIPPSLHFRRPNPELDLEESPFFVNSDLVPWEAKTGPRRAAVSSFGIGGTNAHLVLEQAPEQESPPTETRSRHVLLLSARSDVALEQQVLNYASFLQNASAVRLGDVCFTAACGRRHFRHRLAVVGGSLEELAEQLLDSGAKRASTTPVPGPPDVGVLFGEGTIPSEAVRKLRDECPIVRRSLQQVEQALGGPPQVSTGDGGATSPMERFAVEYALHQLWMTWGLLPAVVGGYGDGEIAAACASGIISLDDALRLLLTRSATERDSAVSEVVRSIRFRNPSVPFVSVTTGKAIDSAELAREHFLGFPHAPVPIEEAALHLAQQGARAFVDVSSRPTVLDAIRRHWPHAVADWLPSLSESQDPWETLLQTVASLYQSGVDFDVEALTSDYGRSRVALPTYPFQRQRFWAEASPAREGNHRRPGSPALLGERAPLAEGTHFTNVLSTDYQPLLADHLVFGKVLVPGAYYLAGIVEVGRELVGASSLAIRDVVFQSPLVVESEAELDTELRFDSEGRYSFRIFSRQRNSDPTLTPWIEHASGTVELPQEHDVVAEELQQVLERCGTPVDDESGRDSAQATAVVRGPSFEWSAGMWVASGEALMRFERPPGEQPDVALPPGLLDSIWGCVLGAAGGSSLLEAGTGPFLPFSVGTLRWLRPAGQVVWGHGRVREVLDDQLSADLTLYDDSGHLLATLERVVLRHAPQAKLLGDGASQVALSPYQLDWRPRPAPVVDAETLAGTWILCGDDDDLAQGLANALASERHAVRRVGSGDDPAPSIADTLSSGNGLLGVVCLTPTQPSPNDVACEARRICEASLLVVQTLAATNSEAPLWFVTRGASPATSDSPVRLEQSALSGFVLSVAAERGDSPCGQIDLDPSDDVGEQIRCILAELKNSEHPPEPQVAYRSRERLVARLRRQERPETTSPVPIAPDATYLVTGGLGALGIRVCHWLIGHGARRIAILSRKGETEQNAPELAALRAGGAEVVVEAVDVADRTELEACWSSLETARQPLRGVIHAAGVLDDAILANQSPERLERVFRPKVSGALHLHELTRERRLDFFVMFSSVSSLLGAKAQSNYAAANAFLDGLAHRRRQLGLPALTINWGPWAGGGMAEQLEARDELAQDGMSLHEPDAAFDALDVALSSSGHAQVGLFAVDWRKFMSRWRPDSVAPLLSDWKHLATPATSDRTTGELRKLVQETPEASRRKVVEDYVQTRLQRALGLSADQLIPPDQPLSELGLDSLMAVEVRDQLSRVTSVRLPATLLFDYPVLDQLCDALLAHMPVQDSHADSPPPVASPATPLVPTRPAAVPVDFRELTLEQAITEVDQAFEEFGGRAS